MLKEAPTPRSWQLPEPLWRLIEPKIPRPSPQPHGGRPPADPKKILATIFFVLRTGIQWKAVPSCNELVSGSTAHEHFQSWVKLGIFNDTWIEALREYDASIGIEWKWQSIDGSMTKAPLGGEKNRAKSHGSGKAGDQTFHSC